MNFTKACSKITFLQIADKILFGAAFAALIFLSACDKPKDFNLKTTSPASHFNVKDTSLPLFLVTQRLDSLRSNNLSTDLAGCMNDALLGSTIAKLYFQVRMLNVLSAPPVAPTVDSSYIYMVYGDRTLITGNASIPQTWSIYPLQGDMDNSIPYYTNNTSLQPNTNIMAATYTGAFNAGPYYTSKDSVLRIPFSNSYAQRIMNSGTQVLGDNPTFQDSFKGFAVIPQLSAMNGAQGAIMHFDLTDIRSRIVIYYHDGTGAHDTMTLIVGDASVRVNTYTHNYANTQVAADSGKAGTANAYLQAMAGMKVRVNLPDLSWFMKDGTTAISEAELVFPESAAGNGGYTEPTQLYLYPRASDGTNESLNNDFSQGFIDQTFGDYGGTWRGLPAYTNNSYSFIMTRHIQNVIDRYRRQSNYNQPGGLHYQGMNLFIPADNQLSSGRMLLKNYDSKATDVKTGPYLRLIYTKIPEH